MQQIGYKLNGAMFLIKLSIFEQTAICKMGFCAIEADLMVCSIKQERQAVQLAFLVLYKIISSTKL